MSKKGNFSIKMYLNKAGSFTIVVCFAEILGMAHRQ